MFRLLNIEIHKLKYSRASRVLIILYFALLTSISLIAAIKFDIGPIQFHLADMGIFNFPYIWHFNTYTAAIFKFFLLLVIVSMMANEYSNKTLKQNLIDGLSKKEFILSKFYTVIALATISTLFVFIVSLVLGYMYSDYTELSIVMDDIEFLFAFFIKLVGFFSFGLFLGVLIKRSAFAVAALLIWAFIENAIIRGLLFWKLKDHMDDIMRFLPLESMSNLIKEPGSRLDAVKSIGKQVGENWGGKISAQPLDLFIVMVWTGIFIYLSYVLVKKRDL